MNWIESFLVSIGLASLVVEGVGLWARLTRKTWGDLISPVMRRDGRRWLSIPWNWGVLGGHFFGPPAVPRSTVQTTAFVVLTLACLVTDLIERERRSKWHTFGALLGGIVVGAFLWAQS